ncbi:uncharacterized protein LOC114019612 isoform X2 [Chelonia mydas]|uniref:uncharacterized protein LOC114019612 isoform X2 n=1 Tax=Chelonia mydas TaxID=8469 RepID=UPI001CA9767D|nr:uncharacterized protein LOC114019612 isoform X2 [Chelonia mydas]
MPPCHGALETDWGQRTMRRRDGTTHQQCGDRRRRPGASGAVPLLTLPAAAYDSPPAGRARGADRDSQLGAIALRPPAAPYGALGSPLSVSPEPLSAGPEVAREAGAQVPPRLRRPERRPNHLRVGLRLPPRPSCAISLSIFYLRKKLIKRPVRLVRR